MDFSSLVFLGHLKNKIRNDTKKYFIHFTDLLFLSWKIIAFKTPKTASPPPTWVVYFVFVLLDPTPISSVRSAVADVNPAIVRLRPGKS